LKETTRWSVGTRREKVLTVSNAKGGAGNIGVSITNLGTDMDRHAQSIRKVGGINQNEIALAMVVNPFTSPCLKVGVAYMFELKITVSENRFLMIMQC